MAKHRDWEHHQKSHEAYDVSDPHRLVPTGNRSDLIYKGRKWVANERPLFVCWPAFYSYTEGFCCEAG